MTEDDQITAAYSRVGVDLEDFDYPEWTRARPVQITRRWSGEDASPSQHAEARLLWSEDSLIVRFTCRQTGAPIVSANPQLDRKTIGVWDRDVCEIFLAPNPKTPHRYYEFEAAPNGEWVDLEISMEPAGRETNWEFRSGMTTAARLVDEQLTITVRIPWRIPGESGDSIPKPGSGDVWRVNLFRCVGTGNERYLAWQPTHTPEPNYHVPEVFGWLIFE